MAFTLGEVLNNMELDLPDATSQPAVSVQKKGFNLITSITAYLIGVSEDKFAEKDGVLAYDGAEYARLEKEEKATETKAPKAEKKRHNHEHVNPYKEKFMSKNKEDKGYTPVRQYSLFDEE